MTDKATLARMLELAGVKNHKIIVENADHDYGDEPTSRKGHEVPLDPYKVKQSRLDQRLVNSPGDNALAESDDRKLADTYHGHRKDNDHGESVARTADEHGVPGEKVEKAVKRHKAYEGMMKTFKDYLREMEEEKEDKEEVEEAYGMGGNARGYDHNIALLPTQQMANLDGLEHNEYFGDMLSAGRSGIVVMAIDANGKTRLTYASTSGDNIENYYKPGETALTYHDQRGNERPAKILFAFSGKTYMDPQGRQQIAHKLEQVGMNAKKKYSLRVFK